ncbi:hypothetical protein UFOVP706_25 [uncultured Caudovirales phage]|uniref:Uncharacterized protein n=1 Tax=uncultured Caudovirales phage TaxID=2100421 RepID=A0A6J5NU35_9CAUD|nr:hypothetical protein UFOVP706_25 [uncultured Caudovirales phage]
MDIDKIAQAILDLTVSVQFLIALLIVLRVIDEDYERARRTLVPFNLWGTFVTIPALLFHVYAWLT